MVNIIILGAAGFIGTNLTLELVKEQGKQITLVDRNYQRLKTLKTLCRDQVEIREKDLIREPNFESFLQGQDIVYQFISTTVPAISNQQVPKEINDNVTYMSKLLEACVKCQVKKIIFPSSGGTVYGRQNKCPLREDMETWPINSYGVQKLMNEKLLYLYHYMYGLDYRIIRLANPYGPYQKPDGVQGVVANFIYKALKGEPIYIYGDGSVIRDYIYIGDAVRAIINIVESISEEKLFNVGSGKGLSIQQLLKIIENVLGVKFQKRYLEGRTVDVPMNWLDISKYEAIFGKMITVCMKTGIQKTADFMKREFFPEV